MNAWDVLSFNYSTSSIQYGPTIGLALVFMLIFLYQWKTRKNIAKKTQEKTIPESVNYHFTRKCNYSCGFCFHTAKTSFLLPLDEAKRGLRLLAEAGEFVFFHSGCKWCCKWIHWLNSISHAPSHVLSTNTCHYI